jgi:hypothetical protein
LTEVGLVENVPAVRTEEYFRKRSLRANRAETMKILARAGQNNETVSVDEVPKGKKEVRHKTKKKSSAASRGH